MLSKRFQQQKQISGQGFRYRGLDPSRLENLTDAVFAFSITLLVIASEVPKTFLELQASMYSFIGFIFCIMLLLGLWNNHSNFFMHYGMRDTFTKMLNFPFLFLLLFYIYPLKYLFSYVGTGIYVKIKLLLGDNSEALRMAVAEIQQSNMNEAQWQDLTIRFGLGLFFLYLLLCIMHVNALKKREALDLNALEIYETRTFIQAYALLCMVPALSMLTVLVLGGGYSDVAGFVYPLKGATHMSYFINQSYNHPILSSTHHIINLPTPRP
ncbi:MAG: DUF1211 domain-containing protein [Flavobacteriales bacterium]|nr:DUF1211 domain-containing protein [Flavobacteriales bacterium]